MKRLFLIAVLVFCWVQPVLAGKTVLVIHSYDPGLAWTRQCNAGIQSALPADVALEFIYLETKSIPVSEFASRADAAFARYTSLAPDLVMLGDDNALRLLGPRIAETGVPVVYFGINNNPRGYFDELPPNVFGVIERIPLFHWIRWLFQIMPRTESVLVLMDGSATAESIARLTFKGRREVIVEGRMVTYASVGDWEEWQQLASGWGHDLLLMPLYHALRDAEGRHVPYDQVVVWTSANSPVPVFATQDYAVGDDGVVGALVVVGEEHGHHAGLIARDILHGDDVPSLATADDQEGRLFFNRKQLDRFSIILPAWAEERAVFK